MQFTSSCGLEENGGEIDERLAKMHEQNVETACVHSKILSLLPRCHDYLSSFWTSLYGSPLRFNPFTAVGAHRALIDFTLSNARRFYSSMGNPLAVERLKVTCW